ncbi:hypothetical protein KX816_06570 [Sphingosinicellaceae bacterium]|nr:hypothetical protein KX816_06570 [Sphingosinicellaceae bacterium]
MADSEDWRRQRAVELGLEPYSNFAKGQPAASNTHLGSPVPSSAGTEQERPGVGEGVVAMRLPPPERALVVASETPRELSLRPIQPVYAVPAAPLRKVTDNRERARRDTPKMSSVRTQAGRGVSLYFAGAVLAAAAAGGAWFALQQTPPPAPQTWVRTAQAEPSVALAALPPAAVPGPDPQRVLPALAAVTCDEPEIVAGLRAAASDQLRRSSFATGNNPPVIVAGVSSARPKVADTGGGLTVCTAALSLRRASGKAATFDVDYAVRAVAGSRPQVVPLGFNHLVDSVAAAAPVEPASAAPRLAALPDVTKKPSRESTTRSRIVVVAKPILVSTGPLANTAPTGFGLPGASTLSLATGEATAQPVVKVPRGCDQPATLSVSITCRNASLLALNAQIAATIAALDQPNNERILARIRNRADLRFDRCQSVPCVGRAYRYWLNELASVTPDTGGTVTAGRNDRETRGSTAYSEIDVPR